MSLTWTFAGTALSTFGVVDAIYGFQDIPDRRGENTIIPFMDGRIHNNKFFDEKVIGIGIVVHATSITTYESTMDNLLKLLSPSSEGTLSVVMSDSTTRTAIASVSRNLSIKRYSPTIAKLVVEFTLAEPYFRSSSLTTTSGTISAGTITYNIVNPGTYDERNPTIKLIGPLANPYVVNNTTGLNFTITGTIPLGGTVSIYSTGGLYSCNGVGSITMANLEHAGGQSLFNLVPGTNSITVTSGTTTGTITTTFYAPYL